MKPVHWYPPSDDTLLSGLPLPLSERTQTWTPSQPASQDYKSKASRVLVDEECMCPVLRRPLYDALTAFPCGHRISEEALLPYRHRVPKLPYDNGPKTSSEPDPRSPWVAPLCPLDARHVEAVQVDHIMRKRVRDAVDVALGHVPSAEYTPGQMPNPPRFKFLPSTGEPINALEWISLHQLLACASEDGCVLLTDPQAGVVKRQIITQSPMCSALRHFPSNDLLAIATRDPSLPLRHNVQVYDLLTNSAPLSFWASNDRILSMAAVGPKMLATGSRDSSLRLFDVTSGKPIAVLNGHTDAITTIITLDSSSTSEGPFVATTSYDGSIKVWDVRTQRVAQSLHYHPEGVHAATLLPHTYVTVSSRSRPRQNPVPEVKLWDVRGGTLSAGAPPDANLVAALEPLQVAPCVCGHVTSDGDVTNGMGEYLLFSGLDGSVLVWSVGTARAARYSGSHAGPVVAVVPIADETVVTCGADKTVRMFSLDLKHF